MITLKRILAPTDFSIITVPAVGYALSLARELGAEVTVVHALPTEVMKEQFMNQYAAGDLAAAAAAPVGLTRQPDFGGYLRKKEASSSYLPGAKDLQRPS